MKNLEFLAFIMHALHKFIPKKSWKTLLFQVMFFATAFLMTSCDRPTTVISNLDEREANMIVVFLESKGIKAQKIKASSGAAVAGANTGPKYEISVEESLSVEAMATLNRNGLPRKQGTNLLELFAKQGLTTSDKEENIRYQSGLAQQITNTILLIDGVIDATVQLSFPTEEELPGEAPKESITAAVYVKHQGMYDDSSLHLENKVKRIVSGSISGLDINDVTVITDRSRFTDISSQEVAMEMTGSTGEFVSIWNIVVNKNSLGKFRFLFFCLTFFGTIFAILFGWVIWKIYPTLKTKGFKELLKPSPLTESKTNKEEPPTQS